MVLILHESEPVASADGWTMTVSIDQVDQTPRGSRHVLKSSSYNFKAGAENETEEARKKRLDVKRNARKRAIDSFDAEKVKAKQQQRKKKRPGAPAAAAAAAAAADQLMYAAVQPHGQVLALPLEPAAALGPTEPDLVTQRDWALLRAWKEQLGPEAVLECLREQALDCVCEEEPWTR